MYFPFLFFCNDQEVDPFLGLESSPLHRSGILSFQTVSVRVRLGILMKNL